MVKLCDAKVRLIIILSKKSFSRSLLHQDLVPKNIFLGLQDPWTYRKSINNLLISLNTSIFATTLSISMCQNL